MPNKGFKFSLESRAKLSKTLKKQWNSGKRKNVGLFQKGNKMRLGSKNPKARTLPQVFKGGSANPAWKGGVTPAIRLLRGCKENRTWVKSVYKRDFWTCQKCGIKGGILEAHHINNFADNPDVIFALDNGITLHKNIHRRFHQIYGNRKNNINQLREFLDSKEEFCETR